MKPAVRALIAAIVLTVASVANGQSGKARPEAPAALFARTCAQCHGATGWGTRALAKRVPADEAELLRRKSIPADVVRYVVRHGIGSMPQFTPTDLSDEELAGLSNWLEKGR
jgi:mono/diheme cytochrome c family protein